MLCIIHSCICKLPSTSTDFYWWPPNSCISAVGRLSALFEGISAAAVIKEEVIHYFCHSDFPDGPRIWTSFFLNAHRCDSLTLLHNTPKRQHFTYSIICTYWKSVKVTSSSVSQRNCKTETKLLIWHLIQTLNEALQLYLASLNKSSLVKKMWGTRCWWRESNLPKRISQFNWFHYMVC